MSEIMSQKGRAFKKNLNPPEGKKAGKPGEFGVIKVLAQSDDGCNNDILITVGQVLKLKSLAGLCRDSDKPYLQIERTSQALPDEVCKGYNYDEHRNYSDFNNYRPLIVYKSEETYTQTGLHPKFKPIKKKMQAIC